jgi:hypothetical protein
MKDVKTSDNIETRLTALSYINSLVNTAEWLKWTWQIKSYDKIKGNNKLSKKEDLDFQLWKLNEQLVDAQSKSDTQKVQSITEQIAELKDKPSWGEVFEAWVIDKVSEVPSVLSESKA